MFGFDGIDKKVSKHIALCVGVSAIVLSACMPDDDVSDKQAEADHNSAKVAHYSQAFQQYSARSLNAVVNSDLWAAQTLPEGSLDLTTSALGSVDLGGAEAYIQSAYCVISGTPTHLTWFETDNDDGSLFLQGLGQERAGQTASKLREMIARENFGIEGGGIITMADGSTVTPTGGCNTLSIPDGSVVAVVPIPEPVQIAQTQEKFIMRALSCPAGTEGSRLQRVMATYMPSGNIVVGASSFTSEAAVMADNGLAWNTLADNCLTPTEQIARSVSDITVDALDVAAIVSIPGEITTALDTNLTDKDCKDVSAKKEREEELNEEESKLYDTCAGPVDITPLETITYDPDTLIKTEEEIITGQCGGEGATSISVTLAPGSKNFKGIHSALSGKAGQLTTSAWSGDSTYRKITRFYEIVEDFGSGQKGRGGACPEGECSQTSIREVVTYQAQALSCSRNEIIIIPCQEMYPQIAGIAPTQSNTQVDLGWTTGVVTQIPVPQFTFAPDAKDGATQTSGRFTATLEGDEVTVVDTETGNEVEAGGVILEETSAGILAQGSINTNVSATLTDSLDYKRSRAIQGWSDTENLIPNEADDRQWQEGTMNCVWREQRVTHIPCQNGWTGSGGSRTDERTFAATSPTNGSWSGWRVASQTAVNCSPPDNNSGNSGGSGGGNCLVAGTRIAMADGSVKTIETIEIGDELLTGRVLQKLVRSYDEAAAQTVDGIIMTQNGLLEYDGIIATGRHPFHINGQWTPIADIDGAAKYDGSQVPVVYNLLTENNIIPVIGASHTLYYASDDLNNWNHSSEKGRLKLLSKTLKVA